MFWPRPYPNRTQLPSHSCWRATFGTHLNAEQDSFCRGSVRQVGLDLARRGLERAKLPGMQQRVLQGFRARGTYSIYIVGN